MTSGKLAAHACAALPLALLSLPVYLHVPKFYAETYHLDLAVLGALLLAVRAFDAVQDPWLGHLSDVAARRGISRLTWLWVGAPLLALGAYGLFTPPPGSHHASLWLVICSVVVYFALSIIQINYYALGAELADTLAERTRLTAWREGFGLFGILLGASVPALLIARAGSSAGYAQFALFAGGVTLALCLVTVCGSPRPAPRASAGPPSQPSIGLWIVLTNQSFRRLLLIHVCSGTAAAVPATLVLFFVEDVLALPALAPHFLIAYFTAGIAAMSLWPLLAARYGLQRTWRYAMLATVAVFGFTLTLEAGDAPAFFAICALSGVALGADLALAPALLADLIARENVAGDAAPTGRYFGLWALATKLNLALAAGVALPLVAWLGYVPAESATSPGHDALRWCYAGLPCVLKAIAAWLLLRHPPIPEARMLPGAPVTPRVAT